MPQMPTLGNLFLLACSLGRELSASLNRVWIGQSVFCFKGERGGRDRPLYLYNGATDLARRVLTLTFQQ